MFWRSLQNCFESDLEEGVNTLIANQRAAPMLDDLTKAVDEAKVRRNTLGMRVGLGQGGFGGVIQKAHDNNKMADKEFVAACNKLLKDKWAGKITHEQFLEGCGYLDQVALQLSR